MRDFSRRRTLLHATEREAQALLARKNSHGPRSVDRVILGCVGKSEACVGVGGTPKRRPKLYRIRKYGSEEREDAGDGTNNIGSFFRHPSRFACEVLFFQLLKREVVKNSSVFWGRSEKKVPRHTTQGRLWYPRMEFLRSFFGRRMIACE